VSGSTHNRQRSAAELRGRRRAASRVRCNGCQVIERRDLSVMGDSVRIDMH